MTGQEKACSSCGVRLVRNSETTFPCPSCGRSMIGRCTKCRDQSVKYTCEACGFSGP